MLLLDLLLVITIYIIYMGLVLNTSIFDKYLRENGTAVMCITVIAACITYFTILILFV
jgi:hypothetical protein